MLIGYILPFLFVLSPAYSRLFLCRKLNRNGKRQIFNTIRNSKIIENQQTHLYKAEENRDFIILPIGA